MAFAADPSLLLEHPGRSRIQSQAGKRASEEGEKHLAVAAGAKKGRAAFGDITNQSSKSQNDGAVKQDRLSDASQTAAPPSTTADAPCEVPSPAPEPTPSHWIKRIRVSDSYDPSPLQQKVKWVDIDLAYNDGLTCPEYVTQTFLNLRVAETKKRPSSTYMETVQNDINASMRGILVDWLVEVAQEYKLHSETLFLAVSYLDRYLSVAPVQRSELQLVGIACMLVASKYEEIYAPTIDDYCYITDHTYSKEQLLRAEQAVLGALRFEVTAPTAKTFVRRFTSAALAQCMPSIHFDALASYLVELSMLDYGMLRFLPSEVAAAAVLVTLRLQRCEVCWHETLSHYTGYEPRNLRGAAQALHALFLRAGAANALPAIKDKYDHELMAAHTEHMDTLPADLFSC